jgi:hypothetical protein
MTRTFESFDDFCGRKRRLESLTKDSSLLKDESFSSLLLSTHKFGPKLPSCFAFFLTILYYAGDGTTFWKKMCFSNFIEDSSHDSNKSVQKWPKDSFRLEPQYC